MARSKYFERHYILHSQIKSIVGHSSIKCIIGIFAI